MNPLIVYLDQNHWIHLSQDYYQRSKSTNKHPSVAMPYCDVVVPDNHWASLAKIERLGLEE